MRLIAIMLSIIMLCEPVLACESFDECLSKRLDFDSDRRNPRKIMVEPTDNDLLKAIAFKLDEISKKLDMTDEDRKGKQFADTIHGYWTEKAENYLKQGWLYDEDLEKATTHVPEYAERLNKLKVKKWQGN